MDMDQPAAKKVTVKIVGAVPRSIKNVREVDKAYAPARKEIQALLGSASPRRPAKAN